MSILLLIFIICGFIGIANCRSTLVNNEAPLQRCLLVLMILITIFGGMMIRIGDLYTNIGSVFYTGVICIQYLIMVRFKEETGAGSPISTLISLSMLGSILLIISSISDGSNLSQAYSLVISNSLQIMTASFLAFVFSLSLFTLIYKKTKHLTPLISYGLNIIIIQAFDSLIFFTVAFGGTVGLSLVLPGYIVKTVLGLLAFPLLSLVIKNTSRSP